MLIKSTFLEVDSVFMTKYLAYKLVTKTQVTDGFQLGKIKIEVNSIIEVHDILL